MSSSHANINPKLGVLGESEVDKTIANWLSNYNVGRGASTQDRVSAQTVFMIGIK